MRRALVLGGTGQIGRALVPRLADAGWEVVAASRGERAVPEEVERHARVVKLNRSETEALRAALENGVDVLVDLIAFEPSDARQLLELGDRIGSLVVITSGSVYADASGRTLDEATSADELPVFRIPILETQRTVAPGDKTYSTKKAAIEEILLGQTDVPTTIVRPWAIHGPGGTQSREWHFVKRILDGRRAVLLDGRGASRFHTTSTANLAELIRLAAQRPGTRVLNCGDPDPPTVLEISRAIAAAMQHSWAEVLFDRGEPWRRGAETVGDTPWSVVAPIVADMSSAEIELGYRPATTYEKAVVLTCEWLVAATAGREWPEVLTGSAKHMADSFDYAAEDAFLAELTAG